MKKNTAGQVVGVQMITAADGTAFTGSVTCNYTIDGGTQTAGTTVTHEGNGFHTMPVDATISNGDHIGFTFTGTGAIPATIQVYTNFPQSVDNNVLAAGATGFAAINTDVELILADTSELQADWQNTGRLDTILDTIAADVVNIDGYNLATQVGTAGANLTNLGGSANNWTVVSDLGTVQTGDSFALIGTAGAGLTNINLPNQTMDIVGNITGNLSGSVGSVSGNVGGTVNLLAATQATIDVIDGTDGLVAISAQIDGIGAASGGALNFEATSDNLTVPIKTIDNVGTPTGVFGATQAEDGVVMSIADAANDIDHIFGFTIGGSRTATEMTFAGYLTGVNDAMLIQAYDFIGAGWDTVAQLPGQSGTTNTTITAQLLSKHTGVGADIGNVYIRFEADGAMTSPTLVIDKLLVAGVNIGQSIGYDQGAVHVDTLVGTAGTEAFVNGVADNPVDSWASAQTIAAAVGISHYHIANGSSVTLDQATDNTEISGDEFTIAFGGFSIDNTSVSHGLAMSGEFLGYPHLLHTAVGTSNLTGPGAKLGYCAIRGACISNSNAGGKWVLHNCWGVDETTAAFDFGAAVGAQTVYITEYSGVINIRNMQTGDVLYFSGNSSVIIAASCTGGTIHFQGAIELTNNGSGQTINYDNLATDAAAILVDTGTTLPARFDGVEGATFNTATDSLEALRDRGDSAWTTGAGGTPPQLLQNTTIATLASQTSFTLTAGSADNDAYNGAVVVVTDSATSTQKAVGSISAYVGATKTVTLSSDPAIFTMAVGDTVDVIANASTAPSAAAVRAEIDANSTQLALIVADTGELQTNQGNWLTATGFSTATEMAKVPKSDGTVSWNATALAAINAEADAALTTYDAPTKAEMDTGFAAVPTATENADALLNRDMSAVSDTTARSPLNALRFLRNKWAVSGTTLTVNKEDDTTSAWTATVTTNAAADPVVGNDPA